jgi:hypothetical protein
VQDPRAPQGKVPFPAQHMLARGICKHQPKPAPKAHSDGGAVRSTPLRPAVTGRVDSPLHLHVAGVQGLHGRPHKRPDEPAPVAQSHLDRVAHVEDRWRGHQRATTVHEGPNNQGGQHAVLSSGAGEVFVSLMRRAALVGGGLVTYVGASYAAYSFLKKDAPTVGSGCGSGATSASTAAAAAAAATAGTWDTLAATYDSAIDYDETFLGIKLLRRWLVRSAQGRILEVSAGTGRNLAYYPLGSRASALTVADRSPEMVATARGKAAKMLDIEDVGRLTFSVADVRPSKLGQGGDAPSLCGKQ